LSDVSKPKKSVVTTEDFSALGATGTILGKRLFSGGSRLTFALNSDSACLKNFVFAGSLE